jgi:hypothetical protein
MPPLNLARAAGEDSFRAAKSGEGKSLSVFRPPPKLSSPATGRAERGREGGGPRITRLLYCQPKKHSFILHQRNKRLI